MRSVFRFVAFVFILLCLYTPAHAQEAPKASDVVQTFYDALLDTMKQGPELGFAGRYQKLEPALTQAFNLPLMARYAVGPAWAKASKEEQTKLVTEFSAFSIATYASRFTKFEGETFTVIGEKPMQGGKAFMVQTKLTPKDSDPVTLNYLVRPDEKGNLRIADVYLDASISELATRRSEFSSVIKREGMKALLDSLAAKVVHMKEGPKKK
ncbi:MAG: ABC transporter substrate-binding protein [Bdellovibrionales bacterium]